MTSWYYVQGSDRVGPITEVEIRNLFQQGMLDKDSYVWRKGFTSWEKAKDVADLRTAVFGEEKEEIIKTSIVRPEFRWNDIEMEEPIFCIKIGPDRNSTEAEYGPYTLLELRRAYREKRINARTMIFSPGMEDWMLLADIPIFQKVFTEIPPVLAEREKKVHVKRPLLARVQTKQVPKVFDGVCRDVTIGGFQILVTGVPVKVGDVVSIDLSYPDMFEALSVEGQVQRILDGDQGFSCRLKSINLEVEKLLNSHLES